MNSLSSVREANRSYFGQRPLVAVCVGGTSGIGNYASRALAAQYGADDHQLRLYIVGRNESAARQHITDMAATSPKTQFEFLQATDLASIKDVDAVCTKLVQLEQTKYNTPVPRIDFLLLTQGDLQFGPRKETPEGLDRTMSLLYYSRIRFITNLLPQLLASPAPHVVSVFGAGLEDKLLPHDLSLRDPRNYSLAQARSHIVHFTTMAFERLARENPRLALVHVFPGIVVTPAFSSATHPWWFKVAWALLGPLVRAFFAMPADESGLRVLSLGADRYPARDLAGEGKSTAFVGSDGKRGSGAYAVDRLGEPVKLKVDYAGLRKQGFEDTVWDHTMRAFDDITKVGKFTN